MSSAQGQGQDPYAAFYYWDQNSNNWAFNYDAFYAAYPQGLPGSSSAHQGAPYDASAYATQSSAYGSAPGSAFSGVGASSSAQWSAPQGHGADAALDPSSGKAKKEKRQIGPKDKDGNQLAGQLKRGETRQTVLRKAVGKLYEDQTLLEWDPKHKRLFVGDLGNDVSDGVLTAAFQKYPSFSKARVIRKKSDSKSKGYGFVAFADPEDFLKAWKEMDGKYIGSRPCRLKKASEDTVPVEIGHRKDRLLANNVKHDDWKHHHKMGGAIGGTLRRNGGFGNAYAKKR
ncbi:RNA-binding domain-containing protein [Ceraceosorus guamensis]|uniref:RNA-binding domain-containing protein n=1 Tax=Ceraceosorus guamensis TaxID=1522189 RepID=A0A316VTB1_9BASI|nr:RNA-binding domain-containing protein [Ceraceosorus guamensis]PWN39451.1 RNA-binding domain-containing protein [Ceraceosorus guamensis]